MTKEINPIRVDTGDKFRVSDKDSRYFGHEGATRAVWSDKVTLELDIDTPGHLVTFEWEQVERV